MRRFAIAGFLAVLLAGGTVAAAAAASGGNEVHGAPVYLALGDSVAAGVGAVQPPGYPERLGALLESGYNPAADKETPHRSVDFDLVNLAVPGAPTATPIADQLPAPLETIEQRRSDRDRRNDVEVITVTIGGNDVFRPVIAACLSGQPPAGCQPAVDAGPAAAEAGLAETLEQLAEAAGRRAEVVVTTYYNPIGSCVLAANPAAVPVADAVLEAGTVPGLVAVDVGLNDRIRRTADGVGVQVTDLYGVLGAADLVGGADCLHPNAAGHQEIAEQAYNTLAR